jgi:dipeptidyl aminopeptidase/acylaminoacyl peptidase
VDEHLAALSPHMRAQLEELSPSRVISRVEAPIYLLHDLNDDSIPFTESRDFAAALTRLNHPHDFVEFGIFQHVQVRSGLGIDQLAGDGLRLLCLLGKVLLISS